MTVLSQFKPAPIPQEDVERLLCLLFSAPEHTPAGGDC